MSPTPASPPHPDDREPTRTTPADTSGTETDASGAETGTAAGAHAAPGGRGTRRTRLGRLSGLPGLLATRTAALLAYGLLCALLGYLVNRAMYPGAMTNDSLHQLDQALGQVAYDDWHPVIMSAGWGLLIDATGDIGALASVQIAFAAACAFLTCWYLRDRSGSFRIGLAGLALLIAPHMVNLLGAIWKDTQMGLAYYAGAVLLLFASRRGRTAWIWGLAAIPFFVYGTLVRKNAVAALIPLLIWLAFILASDRRVRTWVRRAWLRAAAALALVCTLFGGLLIGAQAVTDAATTPAHNSQFTQVMLDDLIFGMPPEVIEASSASPELKAHIAEARGICQRQGAIWDAYWRCWGTGRDGAFTEIAQKDEVIALWTQTLPANLPRYLDYRLETFALFLTTPDLPFAGLDERASQYGLSQGSPKLHHALQLWVEHAGFAQLPWLFSGWFWLAVSSVVGLGLVRRWRSHLPELALLASAWIYIVSYFPVVPSEDYRYIYWPALAVTFALLALTARHWQGLRARLRPRG